MSVELVLFFPDPDHLIIDFKDRVVGPIRFLPPLTKADRNDMRWYLETYSSHYTTSTDDDEANRIATKLAQWGHALFVAAFDQVAAPVQAFLNDETPSRLLTIKAQHPDTLGLPWELLNTTGENAGFLNSGANPVAIRRVAGDIVRLPVAKEKLHLLFVVSRPPDAGFLDSRADPQAVLDAIEAHAPDHVTVEFLRPATFRQLDRRLRDENLPPVDILHFDGHGFFDEETETGYLLFESPNNGSAAVPVAATLNARGPKLRILVEKNVSLVVLSACQSAAYGEPRDVERPPVDLAQTGTLGSVAGELAAAGVPAIVAMTHSILARSTRDFFGSFYGALARGESVGYALETGRTYLREHPEKHEVAREGQRVRLRVEDWCVPTLYGHGAGARLILDSARGESVQPGRPASNLETLNTPGFFGRQFELWQIERAFAGTARCVSIHGFSGQGKTMLAKEAGAWLSRTRLFERVAFIACDELVAADPVAAAQEVCRAAWKLPPHIDLTSELEHVPSLVILDGMDNLSTEGLATLSAAARDWSRCGQSRMLLTGRYRDTVELEFEAGEHTVILVGGIDTASALNYFQALVSQVPPVNSLPERDVMLDWFAEADGHPLAIRQLARYLRQHPVEPLPDLSALCLSEHGQELRDLVAPSLEQVSPGMRENWLPCFGLFRRGVTLPTIVVFTGIDPGIWEYSHKHLETLGLLRSRKLRHTGDIFFEFHPLLAPLLRHELPVALRGKIATRLRQVYFDLARRIHARMEADPREVHEFIEHEIFNLVHTAHQSLLEGDEFCMELSEIVDDFLNMLGLHRPARVLHEALKALPLATGSTSWCMRQFLLARAALRAGAPRTALTMAQEILNPQYKAPAILRAKAHVLSAKSQQSLGQIQAGMASCQLALKDADEHDFLENMRFLNEVWCTAGDLQLRGGHLWNARDCYKSALKFQKLVSTDEGPEQSRLTKCLGLVDMAEHKFDTAAKHFDAARRNFTRFHEDGEVAECLFKLGCIEEINGHLNQAETHFREAGRIFDSLGSTNQTAEVWCRIAHLYVQRDNRPTAERWYQKALRHYRSVENVAGIATTLDSLAELVGGQQDRVAEATAMIEEALALKTTHFDRSRTRDRESDSGNDVDSQTSEIYKTYQTLAIMAERRNELEKARRHRHSAAVAYWSTRDGKRWLRSQLRFADDMVLATQERSPGPLDTILVHRKEACSAELRDALRRVLSGERSVESFVEKLNYQEGALIYQIVSQIHIGLADLHLKVPDEEYNENDPFGVSRFQKPPPTAHQQSNETKSRFDWLRRFARLGKKND
jgi:tetratricopeptide (TPR) repeat protein